MRSKETLIGDFSNLMMGLYERMEELERRRDVSPADKAKLEKWATKIVRDITRQHRTYFFVTDRFDALLHRPKPPNVHTLRPRRRR